MSAAFGGGPGPSGREAGAGWEDTARLPEALRSVTDSAGLAALLDWIDCAPAGGRSAGEAAQLMLALSQGLKRARLPHSRARGGAPGGATTPPRCASAASGRSRRSRRR